MTLDVVQADDALLDMLGAGGYIPSEADDDLTRVLAEWRREARAEPVREIVDTTTAMAVIRAAAQDVATVGETRFRLWVYPVLMVLGWLLSQALKWLGIT